MKALLIALLLTSGEQSHATDANNGIAIGKRLVAAIKGKAVFQDADFVKALGERDKTALRRFATCKASSIDYIMHLHPTRPNVVIRNLNLVAVGFDCKGVPWDTPVGISLFLNGGKISKIEIHNADLMRTH
ncbi:MAG: hypothetical protein ABIW03_00670 [Sphingomicrobium sp.]